MLRAILALFTLGCLIGVARADPNFVTALPSKSKLLLGSTNSQTDVIPGEIGPSVSSFEFAAFGFVEQADGSSLPGIPNDENFTIVFTGMGVLAAISGPTDAAFTSGSFKVVAHLGQADYTVEPGNIAYPMSGGYTEIGSGQFLNGLLQFNLDGTGILEILATADIAGIGSSEILFSATYLSVNEVAAGHWDAEGDITATLLPEPSSTMMACAGLGALFLRCRRKAWRHRHSAYTRAGTAGRH